MRSLTTAVRSAAFLVLISLLMSSSFGQDAPDPGQAPDTGQAQDQDPPGRVARVSLAQGAVSLLPAGTQDWATADINRPLTTGDKLWTDQDSRAELDLGTAAIRLGSTTGFSFLNLDDHTAQMQVTAGTVIVRVRAVDQGDNYEIDTPNLAVSLLEPGQYRVEVNEAGDTTVVEVSAGDAQAAGEGQGYPIHAQQKATFTGTQQLSSMIGTLGAPDELDSWSLSRDREVQNAQSQQYVSTEATGYADLDNNGRWEETPDYGYVWTPTTVVAGWAPYRFGHWVWITPWGWTWVDDASWGFAPFHYGRWVTWHNSWCWVPGPRRVRPVYAPALVAWVGAPAGVAVVGAGVGWFPLGPREVYIPSYRTSPRYVNLVNVTNTVNVNRTYITNVYENRTDITYVNRNVRGAITTTSQTAFTSGQPVGRNPFHEADARTWTTRPVAPAIAPTRGSLVGATARLNVRQPPPMVMSRQVVVRTQPPRAPVPFDRQSVAIRANGGRPLGGAELARLQPSMPSAPVRVVTPRRGDFQRPVPNEPSMAERERMIRDNRQFGSAEGQRPPVAPPQSSGAVPQPSYGNEPRNVPPPRYDRPPRPVQTTPQEPSRTIPPTPPREQAMQEPQRNERNNEFQPRGGEPSQRFDRPPQAETRAQYNQPEEGRAQYNRPQYNQPQEGRAQYNQPQEAKPQYNQPQEARPQFNNQPQRSQFNQPPQESRPIERPQRPFEPPPTVRQAPPEREVQPVAPPPMRQAPPPMPQREAPRPSPQAQPQQQHHEAPATPPRNAPHGDKQS
jgi:hypothetical protein